MKKQQSYQKFAFKLHSTRLRKSNWNLNLSISDAIKNQEIISLADTTILRFIDELNCMENSSEEIEEIKNQIRTIQKNSSESGIYKKSELKKLYEKLNTIQFKEDYLCVVIDKISDYWHAFDKGFKVNGIKYKRLLATTGGIKENTIIFTSEKLQPELKKRLANGRDKTKRLVPAKYGAYEALTCSSSYVVSDPVGILVVKDCELSFYEDVIKLDDSDNNGEPSISYVKNEKIIKNINDGFGLMLPSRADIWSKELNLDYIPSGLIVRPYAFTKGLLVNFDFIEFADKIAHKSIVKDAWGNLVDIHSVDVIITTSMLKLWDSYKSFDDYMENCKKNNYKFCITKACPEELENERNLNYQFIQSYKLSDSHIDELIKPTINEIRDILGDDYKKSILFLRGIDITEKNAELVELDFIKALMIDKRMINDPYVRNCIFKMIKKRIDKAKVGVIKVNGNFQIACGDPFSLCQSIFEMEVTGLLPRDRFYSQYWNEKNVSEVVCFRAPMTCHNNIRKLKLSHTENQRHWYKHMKTLLIFNSWDTTTEAENGEDFDGDQNLVTDNKILLDNHVELPTIICVQRKANEKILTEKDLVQSNIDSFGDDIGTYTNGITSQFNIQSQFKPESEEYKELSYRIMCGQLFQQNAIDKAKGIISNPRPKYWFDYSACKISDTDTDEIKQKKAFYSLIVADKKPYFMQYIYPQCKKNLKKYISDSNKKSQILFNKTVYELIDDSEKSESEEKFINYYYKHMPVGINNCVTNRICRKIENEFDSYIKEANKLPDFDYSILKSQEIDETSSEYKNIKSKIEKIYADYCEKVSKYQQRIKEERINEDNIYNERYIMVQAFKQECSILCPNKHMLSNIVIDICYTSNKSKQFAWDICGKVFIENLLKKNNYSISFPIQDKYGDIEFAGKKFAMQQKKIGGIKN